MYISGFYEKTSIFPWKIFSRKYTKNMQFLPIFIKNKGFDRKLKKNGADKRVLFYLQSETLIFHENRQKSHIFRIFLEKNLFSKEKMLVFS